ncbi:hypothetical protein R6Q59_025002 [Mikania micrantha]
MKRVLNSIYADEEDDPLQKQFKTLEIEWNSIKQSISKSDRRKPTTAGDHLLFQQYDNSPKELMSLLQNDNQPSKPFLQNSEHHDRAAIDIIKQREVDFDNGRLKGRRLFEGHDVGSDDNDGVHDECFDKNEKSEVSTENSCMSYESYGDNCNYYPNSCTDSLQCDEVERGVPVVTVRSSGGRRRAVGRLMICVVMLALAIVVFKCSGEDEQILVPT